jgi:hypothetical protein
MSHSKHTGLRPFFFVLFAVGLAMAFVGCASAKYRLTMREMNPIIGWTEIPVADLAGTGADPLEAEKIEYIMSGKGRYDHVTRSAAEIRAGLVLSQAFTETLTTNVKGLARSYAAAHAADENVKEIQGNTAVEDLSWDQQMALLNLKKKREELSSDETVFLQRSVANTALLVVYLGKTAVQSKELAETALTLTRSVPTDFLGPDAIMAPSVVQSLEGSAKNLDEASAKAPELAKTLARLGEGLKAML